MDKMYERRMALAKLIGMTNGSVAEINSKLNHEMNGDSLAIEGFTRDEFLNKVMNVDKIPSAQANPGIGGVLPPDTPPPGSIPIGPVSGAASVEVVDALRGIQTSLNRIADILKVVFIDREIAETPAPVLDPGYGEKAPEQE